MPEASAESPLSDSHLLAHLKMLAGTELELEADHIAQIDLDTPIVEGLQLDSLKQVVLIASVEEKYRFEFAPRDYEELQVLQTVGDLVRIIRRCASSNQVCS